MRTAFLVGLGLSATAVADTVSLYTNATAYNNLDAFGVVSPYQEYKSHPGIKAPIFLANEWNENVMSDEPYLFLTLTYDESNPYVFDARDMSLVYIGPSFGRTMNCRVQELDGEPLLSFWGGSDRGGGQGDGYGAFMDSEYVVKYNVTAIGLDVLADFHELQTTSDGNVIVSVYNPITFDLTSVGGSENGSLMDSMFQEINPKTGELVFSWSASDNFNVSDSLVSFSQQNWDWFHINSIEKTRAGNYLVSSRHLAVLTLIDGTDGTPIWVMGANEAINQFTSTSGNATDFAFQHFARFLDDDETQITFFDNHAYAGSGADWTNGYSSGKHLKLDADAKTVELVGQYYHPDFNYTSGSQGSYYPLGNDNVLVGWGSNPSVTEYLQDGAVAMDLQLSAVDSGSPGGQSVYRAFKMEWTGKPTWSPRIAVERTENSNSNATVYVSWNGATEVVTWAVYGSDAESFDATDDLKITSAAKDGFETIISLGEDAEPRYVMAVAINSTGSVLGSTNVTDVSSADIAS